MESSLTASSSVLANLKPELRPLDIKELLNFEPIKPAISTLQEKIRSVEYVNFNLIPDEVRLPNWPWIELDIYLGMKECFFVEQVGKRELGQLKLVSGNYDVKVWIGVKGNFGFALTETRESKKFLRKTKVEKWKTNLNSIPLGPSQSSDYKIEQLNSLYLFHQFQNEILSKAMEQIRWEIGYHSQGHNEAVKVFEKVTQALQGTLL